MMELHGLLVSTGLTINNNFTGIAAFGNGSYYNTNGTTASELINLMVLVGQKKQLHKHLQVD